MIEHRLPTPATQKHVLAASGNQCSFPGCSRLIFDLQHETLIGTVAHIKARREDGPRFDHSQTEEDNRSFSNLLALCAEHSKIVDGPKWKDFSVKTLINWKIEHEQKNAQTMDRSWIKPPNSILKMSKDGTRLQFSYWIDRDGRPRLFSNHQLVTINVLLSINLMLSKICSLPDRLKDAKGADVNTVLQQEWSKFDVETSVLVDLLKLFSMCGNITFAEFLGFIINDNDPTVLIQDGAKRINRILEGKEDPIVKIWFKSDMTN